ARPRSFLSCLRGSELFALTLCAVFSFLSCLRGSERSFSSLLFSSLFLSCLRGSELGRPLIFWTYRFLSCLRGSERAQAWPRDRWEVSELPARQRTRATPLRCEATRRLAEKIRPVTQRIDRPATV